ncbi:MAG: EamA family transporter [Brasilonema octagenarum HA4186-MV1]|jgi:drug/metabolite transporter (DMT)-like permease|uniref:EamA/RhaT family transporter n=2 Tax=Brasilonema TaxID=383614 RepID=A0A856MEI2_9CYAN|nr:MULTISPECIES: DMT family transporter [Brasilonema]MBW4627571.1 EamA family transporter [Brasilonema octagenarum HA4186-MV1]NMF63625.1 EamA/RhaT family transporter [Brasilonema octagenarum UFV-OR1]QDL08091.1 EamA/RhaT family transporter [Brasilonema sennae CENA114]QDL14450.1 EamA/RhaT family transporter [Brasilonema octagenarum UFV-E1]
MKKSYLADLVLLGVTFTWGATFVLIKDAIKIIPPFSFVSARFLIAALVLALFVIAFYPQMLRQLWKKEIWLPGIWLGFWLFAGYAFQTFGLQYTTASKAGFITGLSVVIVPFFSLWLLRHSLKRNTMLGVSVAMLGLILLSHNRELSANIGDILVFFCAISYAFQITLVGRYTQRFPALLLALIQIFTCGCFSFICAVLFENYQIVFLPKVFLNEQVFSALIICSVIATAFAYAAQNQFQKFTTPTRTALIFATEPVFAALIGYWYVREHLSTMQISGCLLMLGGTLISEFGGLPLLRDTKK